MTSFLLYLLRWQLSTLILAPVIGRIKNRWIAAIVANLIGGIVFFFVDQWIFRQ